MPVEWVLLKHIFSAGKARAVELWLDFDEADPGYLAHELSVCQDRRPVADADLSAVARLVAVQQFWSLE